jgi:hypothetical protein
LTSIGPLTIPRKQKILLLIIISSSILVIIAAIARVISIAMLLNSSDITCIFHDVNPYLLWLC